MKVIFFRESFDDIPYIKDFSASLEARGWTIEEHLWSTLFLFRIMRLGKPDILHLHSLHPFLLGKTKLTQLIKAWLFAIQVYILNFLGTKTLWTVHEWSHKLDGDITLSQGKVVGYCFHALIVHCETTKHEIEEAFALQNKDRVFIVPHHNYIDTYPNEISRQNARRTLGIDDKDFVFLIFGSIYPHKGHLLVLEAFQKLQRDKLFLVIAGKPENKELKQQIEYEIINHSNIHFVGRRIEDDEVQVYMNACDCVVLPYKVFTTSGVAVLSMSFGRACIAPHKGFFSDILGEAGAFLYDSSSTDGLFQAMELAIESRTSVESMGKHNRHRAEEWSWYSIVEKTVKIYEI